jgi:hypothetical protein
VDSCARQTQVALSHKLTVRHFWPCPPDFTCGVPFPNSLEEGRAHTQQPSFWRVSPHAPFPPAGSHGQSCGHLARGRSQSATPAATWCNRLMLRMLYKCGRRTRRNCIASLDALCPGSAQMRLDAVHSLFVAHCDSRLTMVTFVSGMHHYGFLLDGRYRQHRDGNHRTLSLYRDAGYVCNCVAVLDAGVVRALNLTNLAPDRFHVFRCGTVCVSRHTAVPSAV